MNRGGLKVILAGAAFVALLVFLAYAVGRLGHEQDVQRAEATSAAIAPPTAPARTESRPVAQTQGFLYGRITSIDGTTYEGRLRWGGGEEAFWGDYFNGAKKKNPWLALLPPDRLPEERRPIEVFGIRIGSREGPSEVKRLFMARFGDIARVEPSGADVRVTLKSGTIVDLNRFDASDFDDEVLVWDATRGVVDLDNLQVRRIELLPTRALGEVPSRLHGTVRTPHGEFTGFVQWNRVDCVGSDELEGQAAEGRLRLGFDTIRSIARPSGGGSLVTLLTGREIVFSDAAGERGIYVDDPRYGRVLISWDAFERVDFGPGGSGPAYGDFPPGRPLAGSVTTRGGGRFTGRLVFDLDESETTETLDAPSHGVDYTIPLGLIASIAPSGGVTLHSGAELQLERTGDLGAGNAGMLIFVDGRPSPEYVPWTSVERVELERPPAMYPPLGPPLSGG